MSQECQKAESLILSKLFSSVSPEENQFLETHLKECGSCSESFKNRLRQQGIEVANHEDPIGFFFDEREVHESSSDPVPEDFTDPEAEKKQKARETLGSIPEPHSDQRISRHPVGWAFLILVLGLSIYLFPHLPEINGARLVSYSAGDTTPAISEVLPFQDPLELYSTVPETISPPYIFQPKFVVRRGSDIPREKSIPLSLTIRSHGETLQRLEGQSSSRGIWRPQLDLRTLSSGTYELRVRDKQDRIEYTRKIQLLTDQSAPPSVHLSSDRPFHPIYTDQSSGFQNPSKSPHLTIKPISGRTRDGTPLLAGPYTKNSPFIPQGNSTPFLRSALLPEGTFELHWRNPSDQSPQNALRFSTHSGALSFFWMRPLRYTPEEQRIILQGIVRNKRGKPVDNATYNLRINQISPVKTSENQPRSNVHVNQNIHGKASGRGRLNISIPVPDQTDSPSNRSISGSITINHPDYSSIDQKFDLTVPITTTASNQNHREVLRGPLSKEKKPFQITAKQPGTFFIHPSTNVLQSGTGKTIRGLILKNGNVRARTPVDIRNNQAVLTAPDSISPPYWCIIKPETTSKKQRKNMGYFRVNKEGFPESSASSIKTRTTESKPVVEQREPVSVTQKGGPPEWANTGGELHFIGKWIGAFLMFAGLFVLFLHGVGSPISGMSLVTIVLGFLFVTESITSRIWHYFGGVPSEDIRFVLPGLVNLPHITPSNIPYASSNLMFGTVGFALLLAFFGAYRHAKEQRPARIGSLVLLVILMGGLTVLEPASSWINRSIEITMAGTLVLTSGFLFVRGWFPTIRFLGISAEGIAFFSLIFVTFGYGSSVHSSEFRDNFETFPSRNIVLKPSEPSVQPMEFPRFQTTNPPLPISLREESIRQKTKRENRSTKERESLLLKKESTPYLLHQFLEHNASSSRDDSSATHERNNLELLLLLSLRQSPEGAFPLFPGDHESRDLISTAAMGILLRDQNIKHAFPAQTRQKTYEFLRKQLKRKNNQLPIDSFWKSVWGRKTSISIGKTLTRLSLRRIDKNVAKTMLDQWLSTNSSTSFSNVTDTHSVPLKSVLNHYFERSGTSPQKTPENPVMTLHKSEQQQQGPLVHVEKQISSPSTNDQTWIVKLTLHNRSMNTRPPLTIRIHHPNLEWQPSGNLVDKQPIRTVFGGNQNEKIITNACAPGEKMTVKLKYTSSTSNTEEKPEFRIHTAPAISPSIF